MNVNIELINCDSPQPKNYTELMEYIDQYIAGLGKWYLGRPINDDNRTQLEHKVKELEITFNKMLISIGYTGIEITCVPVFSTSRLNIQVDVNDLREFVRQTERLENA